MKNFGKEVCIFSLVFLFALFCAVPVWAADAAAPLSDGVFTYEVKSSQTGENPQVSLTGVAQGVSLEDAIIPEEVTLEGQTYGVTAIAAGAFLDSGIKAAVIPDGVKAIDSQAFPAVGGTAGVPEIYCNTGSAAEAFAKGREMTCHTDSVKAAAGQRVLTAGGTTAVKITEKPAFLPPAAVIRWTSSDAAIAAVDDQGTVTAKASGTVTLTGEVAGLKANVTLSVTEGKPALTLAEVQKSFKAAAHVQNKGWMADEGIGKTIGTTGQGLHLEAIRMATGQAAEQLGLGYQLRVSGQDWQEAKTDGLTAGTTGQGLATEGIRITLTGTQAQYFDIYYRVHSAYYGWLDWAANGADAGAMGVDCPLQAVEVRIVEKGGDAPGPTARPVIDASKVTRASVVYQVHGQDYGWQSERRDGEEAGTTGQSRRLEAIKLQLTGDGVPLYGAIQFQTHVQNIGWSGWTSGGNQGGTTGRGLRMEAIRIRLTGPLAETYDIYYRVHAENFGWLGWAKNGEEAGTSGLAYRIEAVQIELVAKGGDAPGSTEHPYMTPEILLANTSIQYQSHVQNLGWQDWCADGATSGTTGQGLAVEAFQIKLDGLAAGCSSVGYQAYVQDIGWQGWRSSGQIAGTTGQGRRVEAFQVNLSGVAAQAFDVYYQAHVRNYGWLGWAKNGEWAGTSNGGLRLEGYNVKLVRKGAPAPGGTGNHFIKCKASAWVPAIIQNPELPTGCESVALTIALQHYGLVFPKTFVADNYIPCWSDGINGFTGNPHSSSGGGCLPPAITDAANRILSDYGAGVRAYNITGTDFNTLYQYIYDGKPIILWSTMYMAWPQLGQGSIAGYNWYFPEHCVVMYDYNTDNNTVMVSDPLEGYVVRDAGQFQSIYDAIGQYAVVIQ